MATWKKIITAADDTTHKNSNVAYGSDGSGTLPVANGGTGSTSMSNKAVLISQDAGTDAMGSVTLTTDGQIVIGGSSGPTAGVIAGGDGITVTNSDGGISIVNDNPTAENTQNEYATSFVDSTDDILLRLTESGAGSGTQDIKFVAGTNVTLTYTDANNITISASDTDTQDLGTAGNTITLTNGGAVTAPYATTAGTANAGDSATGFFSSGTIEDARLPATISSDVTGSSASCTGNALTATTAAAGDSATGFFSSGTIEDARLPATISSDVTGSSASCTGNAVTATTAGTAALVSGATQNAITLIGPASGTLTVDDDLVVSGDLTVSGAVTTVSTEEILLADNKIVLNSNETGSPTADAGITIERGTSVDSQLFWDESAAQWSMISTGDYYSNSVLETSVTSMIPSLTVAQNAPSQAPSQGCFFYDTDDDALYVCTVNESSHQP